MRGVVIQKEQEQEQQEEAKRVGDRMGAIALPKFAFAVDRVLNRRREKKERKKRNNARRTCLMKQNVRRFGRRDGCACESEKQIRSEDEHDF